MSTRALLAVPVVSRARASRAASARLLATLIPAALVPAAIGCSRSSQTGARSLTPPPSLVKVAAVRAEALEDATEYVATLKSLRSTTIQPQIDGQITSIVVRSGDRVPRDASLMQIDPRRQQAALSSQQAERSAKEAAVTFARQQQGRLQELFAAGAVSRQELDQAETALRTAQADLESLDAQVRQQQVQLRYYTVTAPTAGIVGDIPVRVGSQVTTSTLLTTIDENETLEVYVSVPIERAGDLKRGLPMQILSSEGQPLAKTTIGFISPHVDDQTQSLLVKGQVRNPGGDLRPSQFVRARIVWKTSPGILIPVTAVLRIGGQYFAFVAADENGKLVARQRAVKLGPIVGNDYTVLDGLKPGDHVVMSGIQKLADGAAIAAQVP